jgi:hypothetical protein
VVPRQHYRSIARCDVCGDCGRALAPDDPVWTGWTTAAGARWSHPVCSACQPRYVAMAMKIYWYRPTPCEWCGRAVAFLVPPARVRALVPGWYERGRVGGVIDVAPRHRRAFCSSYCRSREASSQRVRARLRAQQRLCEVCGASFVGTRADARSCSPACRQKAYRQRQ